MGADLGVFGVPLAVHEQRALPVPRGYRRGRDPVRTGPIGTGVEAFQPAPGGGDAPGRKALHHLEGSYLRLTDFCITQL